MFLQCVTVHMLNDRYDTYRGKWKKSSKSRKNVSCVELKRCVKGRADVYLCLLCVGCLSSGQQDHRNDLSHPIHADNCLLDPEANECWKEPPAYTYRDYR